MRSVSNDYKAAIRKNSRVVCSKLIFSENEIDDTDIISISINESILSGEEFQLGGAIATNVDIEISNYLGRYNEVTFKDLKFKLIFGIELANTNFEYVEYGEYKVFEVKETGKSLKLECYDSFIDMDIPYKTTLQYPQPVHTIISDISKVFKIKLSDVLESGKYNNSNLIITERPEDATYRQILKDIATIVGGFAIIKNGELDIITIQETDIEINPGNFMKTTITSNYESISFVDLNGFTVGKLGGNKLELDIPLLDANTKDEVKEVASGILKIYENFTYTGFKSDWQGDFSLETGDSIKVTDINNKEYISFVSSNKLSYSGGFKSTTEAKLNKKIAKSANREVQRLQNKIKEAENGMYYYCNNNDVNVMPVWGQFAFIGFSLNGSTNLLLNVAIQVEGTGTLECKLLLDSNTMGFTPKIKVNEFGLLSFTIPLVQLKGSSSHGISIMLKSSENMVVKREQGQITIYGDKLSGALSDEYPHAEVKEEIKYDDFYSLQTNLTDNVSVTIEKVINIETTDEVNYTGELFGNASDNINIETVEFGYISDINNYSKSNYEYDTNSIVVDNDGMTIKTLENTVGFIKVNDIYEVDMLDSNTIENIFSEVK
ncbi:hypothetical protein [Clostridium perfringens]|uniref:hypothetical protein n=1 Tax=Clostridium perfringens TaxID=1502 RepID=UPI001C85DC15|nr:hypothetical protein [Clostridium perfringens]WCM71356.1 hypothetical protein LZD60_08260 [Clostridium perfringens]